MANKKKYMDSYNYNDSAVRSPYYYSQETTSAAATIIRDGNIKAKKEMYQPHSQQIFPLPKSIIQYHQSAREIIFPNEECNSVVTTTSNTTTASIIVSSSGTKEESLKNNNLPSYYGPKDVYQPLLLSSSTSNNNNKWHQPQKLTEAESEVVEALSKQIAVVKTVGNSDWAAFLQHFHSSISSMQCYYKPENNQKHVHCDIPPGGGYSFNSFVTSTSLLPERGKKMRCFGSISKFTIGVVFKLPDETDNNTFKRTKTWAWPSGYSAKTEFNIDSFGNLINGRDAALVSLQTLREQNKSYLRNTEYHMIGNKMIKGGLKVIPYNEVYVRVGGVGRLVRGFECGAMATRNGPKQSLARGIGLPVALFARSWTYLSLVTLLRKRAQMASILGKANCEGIPLLVITIEEGVRVITSDMVIHLLKIMALNLRPFQNPTLAHKTAFGQKSKHHLDQKRQEAIDLESDMISNYLSLEECASIAGGFGATNSSVVWLLTNAFDKGRIKCIVHDGLAAASLADDYRTARQILISYTVVWGKKSSSEDASHFFSDPPPPLDTRNIRDITKSDGVLIVLGAAQILSTIKDGSANYRIEACIYLLDEWIKEKRNSVVFWLSKGYEGLKNNVAKEIISQRKHFRIQLQRLYREMNSSDDISFCLLLLHEIIVSPRVESHDSSGWIAEILQYVFDVDTRFTVSLLSHGIELAASCLLEAGDGGENPFALFKFLKKRSLFLKGNSTIVAPASNSPWSNIYLTNRIFASPQVESECGICIFLSWLIPRFLRQECDTLVTLPRAISRTTFAGLSPMANDKQSQIVR